MKRTALAPSLVIALTLSACGTRTSLVDLYGQPAPTTAAERTIVISPDTKHVNVEGGEIIRFVADGKEFAWNFNTAGTITSFNLNEVAPPNVLNHPVQAYVSPDPKYMDFGGDSERDDS